MPASGVDRHGRPGGRRCVAGDERGQAAQAVARQLRRAAVGVQQPHRRAASDAARRGSGRRRRCPWWRWHSARASAGRSSPAVRAGDEQEVVAVGVGLRRRAAAASGNREGVEHVGEPGGEADARVARRDAEEHRRVAAPAADGVAGAEADQRPATRCPAADRPRACRGGR